MDRIIINQIRTIQKIIKSKFLRLFPLEKVGKAQMFQKMPIPIYYLVRIRHCCPILN